MKTVSLERPLLGVEKYIQSQKGETVVFTNRGKAVAALMPVNDDDLEDIALSENPKFLAIMRRADEQIRKGQYISSEEIRKKYNIPARRKSKKARR
jgi:antitoxin (DNA-binding transcriptional repressor) of toxin-antitoxin stability system